MDDSKEAWQINLGEAGSGGGPGGGPGEAEKHGLKFGWFEVEHLMKRY